MYKNAKTDERGEGHLPRTLTLLKNQNGGEECQCRGSSKVGKKISKKLQDAEKYIAGLGLHNTQA